MTKALEAFRTISEVADELEIPKHVLRFWEVKFPQIRPMKRGGGRRYYRPQDMELLRGIQRLLHSEGYTIKGVQKILREQGVDSVKRSLDGDSAATPPLGATASRADLIGMPQVRRPAGKATRGKAAKSAAPTRSILIQAAIDELRLCREILARPSPRHAQASDKPRQA